MPKKAKKLFIILYSNGSQIQHEGTLASAKLAATKNAPDGCDIRVYEGKMQIRCTKYATKGVKSGKWKLTAWRNSRC